MQRNGSIFLTPEVSAAQLQPIVDMQKCGLGIAKSDFQVNRERWDGYKNDVSGKG